MDGQPNPTRPLLYAEDDDNDVFIMRRAAKDAGIANPIVIAPGGQEAIDYLAGTGRYADRNQFAIPCLLLVDLKMPRVSGFEVIAWVRKQPELDSLPIIVLSSSTHGDDMQRAYALRANAYLVKPPTAAKLAGMLQDLKDFWFKHNQSPIRCLVVENPGGPKGG